MEQTTVRKVKCIMSLMKEKIWLREMAQQGLILKNIDMGVIYTFERRAPQNLVYDVDRYDLPKHPTLHDIQAKEQFVSFAEEMGWKEVTHDEDMNYYFCKPYEEEGVNEIYDTEEQRKIHAMKYRERYHKAAKEAMKSVLVLDAFFVLLYLLTDMEWLLRFGLIWTIFMIAFACFGEYVAVMCENDFAMSEQEWLRANGRKQDTKKEYHLFLTTKGLTRYLQKQSSMGWHIIRSSALSYSFEKGPETTEYYVMDSKRAVNIRRRKRNERKIADSKDINRQNNDWQVESVKEAKEKGLTFACAYGNNHILYKSDFQIPFEGQSRFVYSWLMYWIIIVGIAFVAGFMAGFLSDLK